MFACQVCVILSGVYLFFLIIPFDKVLDQTILLKYTFPHPTHSKGMKGLLCICTVPVLSHPSIVEENVAQFKCRESKISSWKGTQKINGNYGKKICERERQGAGE